MTTVAYEQTLAGGVKFLFSPTIILDQKISFLNFYPSLISWYDDM